MNQVVVMPYPGRGHINPLMNLCNLLSSRLNHNTLFNFVVTEEWLQLIGSDPKPDNLRFVTIPNVIPSEFHRGSDTTAFFTAVQTEMETPFELLLDRMELPVKLIIADATLRWPFDVANRRNIQVAAYWPMSASMFTLWYHVDLLLKHQHIFVDLSGKEEELIDYVPGLSPMKLTDVPRINQKTYHAAPNLSAVNEKAQSLLLTTVYELETEAINALKDKFTIPIYTFGPNIPNLSNFQLQSSFSSDESNYFSWLDSKPRESVLYISLGSFLSVSSAQMDEIAAGLKQSGVSFLWAARGETSRLNDICGDEGMVVEWCDQLRVLSHPSVGGFLSHCGWNSTKESVFSGVPMLTFPIAVDQTLNSKVIVEDWKIGRRVGKEVLPGTVVKREEIAEVVRRFMESESVERKEMMKRVKILKDICQESVVEGGSAIKDVDSFIKDNLISIY